MFKRTCAAIAVLSLVLMARASSVAAGSDEMTLLVVPAKPAIISIASDVAKMRRVCIVSYQTAPKSSEIVLHAWDPHSQNWLKTTLDDYATGRIFDPAPGHIVLIGSDEGVMKEIEDASAWGAAKRMPVGSIMDIFNSLNGVMKFTAAEWRFLARRHGLKLKDLNADRRRYGRYGKPGAEAAAPLPEVEEISMQPREAPVVVTPAPVERKQEAVEVAPEDK